MLRGRNQMRSRNINAPDRIGVRPNPAFGDITQFESTGRSQSDRLTVNRNYRVPQQRMFMGVNYTLGQEKNYADGATSLPPTALTPTSTGVRRARTSATACRCRSSAAALRRPRQRRTPTRSRRSPTT